MELVADGPSQTVSSHIEPQQKRMGFLDIWNMNFGFLGIQFGWGLQLANMSGIYTFLGANPDQIPLLWLAGPMTGLLIQPLVGMMSDRTWNKLGRRRPYFLIGAIFASIGLFFMPDSPALWAAASLLWILDASINVSMEPFRAFVADKLPHDQRTLGFVMQSFFIGLGATMANMLPYLFRMAGVTGTTASNIPLTLVYSFKIGAGVFLAAVLWTIFTTRETPPADLEAFRKKQAESNGFASGLAEIKEAIAEMPLTMKQLGLVQIFTWLGLFCMWMFFGLTTAEHVFGATDPKSTLYAQGIEWSGICFAVYSIVCFVVAFGLSSVANVLGRKGTHALALTCGGVGLLSVYWIHDQNLLLLPMVGVGIAWASILAMPYAMLSSAIPAHRMGVYMGLFNMFIVLPEIIASLTFKNLVGDVFGNNPLYVVMLGGAAMLVAALLALTVKEHDATKA